MNCRALQCPVGGGDNGSGTSLRYGKILLGDVRRWVGVDTNSEMMKVLLLGFLLFVGGNAFAQTAVDAPLSKGHFPERWDSHRDLRGQHRGVLAWGHFRDTRPFEYKKCLLLTVGTDSLGEKEYWIEEQFTNKKPYRDWSVSSIHFAPAKGELAGHFDLHLKAYKTLPNQEEIYALMQQWLFSLHDDGFVRIEGGLDVALWLKYFGFEPDPGFGGEE